MTWLLLSVLSAVALGLYEVSKKRAVQDNAVLPVLLGSSVAGFGALVPLVLLSWWGPAQFASWGFSVYALTPKEHLLVLVKATLVSASWVLSFFAIKHLPISLAAPVRASAPFFTVLGAVVLFQERPSSTQWLGMLVIFASYYALHVVGKSEGVQLQSNRWVALLFAGTLLGSASGLYDKHLLQSVEIPPTTLQFWFATYNVLLQAVLVAALWWPRRRQITRFHFHPAMVAVGVLLVVADQLYFRALATTGALISVVSLVRRSSLVLSFSLGGATFKEENLRTKAYIVLALLFGLTLTLL